MSENGLSYSDVYKNLDGMTALTVAASISLRKEKVEKDTAFVKRKYLQDIPTDVGGVTK